eukprot:TRINITY_DN4541_c0_g2_i1.p1 TRINITY_DN4541_c0_g2~~TRINITY_DN4541_c0_g2_i1.p1  ORF type:complete len:193 (-),score=36.53 TRINITY_DN4541_c0_g2_i1:14-592(-)
MIRQPTLSLSRAFFPSLKNNNTNTLCSSFQKVYNPHYNHRTYLIHKKYYSTSNNNKDNNNNTMDWSRVTDEEWKQRLTPEQYHVAREKGTERPWTGQKFEKEGDFRCVACKSLIFAQKAKFESGCGWPAFYEPIPGSVKEFSDVSHGMVRTEVVCATCNAHLGHVFKDAPSQPTGLRFCINAVSLDQEKPDH